MMSGQPFIHTKSFQLFGEFSQLDRRSKERGKNDNDRIYILFLFYAAGVQARSVYSKTCGYAPNEQNVLV